MDVIRLELRMMDWVGVRFVVVAPGADAVEELSARAEVEAEVEVVRGLGR